MDELLVRAERFLVALADRGDRARLALEAGRWEDYLEAMRWKTAAFHHFRSVDHILEERYPGYLKDEHWQTLWQRVQTSDRELVRQVEIYQTNLNKTLTKLQKSKVAVARYHSGQREPSAFVDGV